VLNNLEFSDEELKEIDQILGQQSNIDWDK